MTPDHLYNRSTIVGRADLLAAFGNDSVMTQIAMQLGWKYQAPASELHQPVSVVHELPAASAISRVPTADSTGYPDSIDDIALWLPVTYTQLQPLKKPANVETGGGYDWTDMPQRPAHRPLAPWSILRSRLRQRSQPFPGHQVDLPELVGKLARRELIKQVPRLPERRWGQRLTIVIDNSVRLIPFDFDQSEVIRHLQKELSGTRIRILKGSHPCRLKRTGDSSSVTDEDESPQLDDPPTGCDVLVLGDLGLLAPSPAGETEWYAWGRRQKKRGCRLVALVPCQPDQVTRRLRSVFGIQPWQARPVTSVSSPHEREAMVQELLKLVSPAACRVEPGLLRELRLLLPEASDASLESTFWRHTALLSRHEEGATLDEDTLEKHSAAFQSLDANLRQDVLERIRAWHLPLETGSRIWMAEYMSLSDESKKLLPESDRQDAERCIQQLDVDRKKPGERTGREVAGFCSRRTAVLSDTAFESSSTLQEWKHEYHPLDGIAPGTDDPRKVPIGDLRTIAVQIDDQFVTANIDTNSDSKLAQLLVSLKSTNAVVQVAQPERSEAEFWKTGRPRFVSDYGTDQYGAWFEFQVPRADGAGVVTQRLRWIPAGVFQMGSADNEEGRGDDEVQHEVTLTRGYWLGDTACTQELWSAVVGDNPSHFSGDDLPVEHVSYDDVNHFLSALGEVVAGLDPVLPTEAQWEYGCRSGTTTPFSFGDTISSDEVNFNGDYPYGDSAEGEYREEPVGVKSLSCNDWGLYQMHGNVWEWCSDWHGEYSERLQLDPSGPESGSVRVVRGGSWSLDARFVRSAYRFGSSPGLRSNYLGFRLLSSASAEPTEGEQVPVAEQGSERTRFGKADEIFRGKTVQIDNDESQQIEISGVGPIRIRSNLEEIHVRRTPKPDWAVEYGQDMFGVYAGFEVPAEGEQHPATQRMRWVPPGQFQMGSPESEPGRYDDEMAHSVTISDGFWMFDTPCTQRLWTAISSTENPSRFIHPNRPVEKVSWDEANEFADRLAEIVGLSFRLPTEAQWEHACRAGTSTATYTGSLEILGDANAPDLDAIAWYGGNSGHEFDLDDGVSITWASDKQYSFEEGGTRQVKLKGQNPWGMYDMLGNVWEWCSDWDAKYSSASQVDPTGPVTGSNRVVRGGSWYDFARDVRSAYRFRDSPGFRYDYLGFRLLSSVSQAPQVRHAEQVSVSRAKPRDEAVEK